MGFCVPLITQDPKLGHTWGEVSERGKGNLGVSSEDRGALGLASLLDGEAPREACRESQALAVSGEMG